MGIVAYVLVKTKPGTSARLVSSRLIRNVRMAHSTFGRYDAILVISVNNTDELSKILYEVIEAHPEVEHTETLLTIPYPSTEEKKEPQEKVTTVSAFHCPSCNSLNERGTTLCLFCGFELR